MKSIKLFLLLVSFSQFLHSIEITSYGVDGKTHNTNVVIKDRNPIIFFEYDKTTIVRNFEIKLSTTSLGLISAATIWYINQTTTSFNTINNITRIEIPSVELNLKVKTTYYLMLTVYDISSSSASVTDTFYTTLSAAKLENSFLDIDYKNPFSPKMGEKTQIRYRIDKDMQVKICVFSISGRYLRTLADHFALKDMVYTVEWDGKDEKGEILPSGIYIVSLLLPSEAPTTKLVGIVEKK